MFQLETRPIHRFISTEDKIAGQVECCWGWLDLNHK